MRNLYLRIYATLVVVLLLFASASGWLFQRHLEQERGRADSVLTERMGAWAELIQRSLPGHDAALADQAAALLDWSSRLRLPLALDSATGQRVAASESFLRRQQEGGPVRGLAVHLEDGRTLWIMRPGLRRQAAPGAGAGIGMGELPPGPPGPIARRGPGRMIHKVRPSSSRTARPRAPAPSCWRRRYDSELAMRWPAALSSASGRRSRCDQSRSAAAWSSVGASVPGRERWISSAHAPMRSVSTESARPRSCSRWRWNSQPDAAANSSSTTTSVA